FNDSAKKRGPPKGYIEALENRLHRMESLLGGLVQGPPDRAKLESDAWAFEQDDDMDSIDTTWTNSSDGPLFPPQPPASNKSSPLNSAQGRRTHHRHTDSSISNAGDSMQTDSSVTSVHNSLSPEAKDEDDVLSYDKCARDRISSLADSLETLSLDTGGFMRYLGNSSGIDMLQRSQLLRNGSMMVPVRFKEHRDWMMQKEFMVDKLQAEMPMPPRDLAEHLIDCYFKFIHPNMPILHMHTFMRQYRSDDPSKRPPGTLLNAMFAAASRFTEHPEIYFDRAKRLIDYEYELPRLSSIQALLLMTIYRFTSSKAGGRVWVQLGMATRMAQDLGMHRDSARWHLPPMETEIRKRLWWTCYVMDRWVSVCMGRPVSIDDDDCDVEYPSLVEQDYLDPDADNSVPNENVEKLKEQSAFALDYFVEIIKLSQIGGEILQRVYSAKTRNLPPHVVSHAVTELDTRLTKWLQALPPRLRYDHKVSPLSLDRWVASIHSSYYSILILLHRPHMVPWSLTKTKLSESLSSLNICISAANSIVHLAERLVQDDSIDTCWCFITFDIFIASLIHLTNSASLDVKLQSQARINLVRGIAAMKRLGKRWFNSEKFSGILEDIVCANLRMGGANSEDRPMDMTTLSQPQTPASSATSPSSSPSTPAVHNPDSQSAQPLASPQPQQQQEKNPVEFAVLYDCASINATPLELYNGGQPTTKPKRPQESINNSMNFSNTSMQNMFMLLPAPSTSAAMPMASMAGAGVGLNQGSPQPIVEPPLQSPTQQVPAQIPLHPQSNFTFSSLSTLDMFGQDQDYLEFRQLLGQDPSTVPSLSQPLQAQQPQRSQPFSLLMGSGGEGIQQQQLAMMPLFSSTQALQERIVLHQQQQRQQFLLHQQQQQQQQHEWRF
ncbi:Transcriptional activator of fatty acid utilization, partial [Lunasporangiospora selenospora]